MDLEKFLAKVSGIRNLSSSAYSTPEKNGHLDDASRSPEFLQEILKSGPKKEFLRKCCEKDKKNSTSAKGRMTEAKSSSRTAKKQDSKKTSLNPNNQPSRKQHRKGETPTRLVSAPEQSPEFESSNSRICKNASCRAVLSLDDTFCKRCSCCICHLFDDNKDPSLWLVCSSELPKNESCGLSCHIECAQQRERVGVVDHGQLMQLDGSYCCATCGKVTSILGCWKKQLSIAKDARRLDVLCYRIYLSYRLLNGTSKFKELHEIIKDAKAKLETEVGPLDGVTAKMARGIVSRLSIAGQVQKLCSLAIEKADVSMTGISNMNLNSRDGSLPAACKFVFEEVTSSSVIIIIIDTANSSTENIEGYKLWYYKRRDEMPGRDPVCVFPKAQRRILVSNLQPCTEYAFEIVSYADSGDLGHSEAKCFTKSVEIIRKNPSSLAVMELKMENHQSGGSSSCTKLNSDPADCSSGFKVVELGKILHLGFAQQQGHLEGCRSADLETCCGISRTNKPETLQEKQLPLGSRGLDLNVVSVPDLNEELTPPFETSRDEDNDCTLHQIIEADDEAFSQNLNKEGLARSHGSGDSHTWTAGNVAAVNSQTELCRKREGIVNEETHDCDSTLIHGSPIHMTDSPCSLDENFEYCIKTIRWLECEGQIKQEFRLKLLTWFSLRSTEQERRVVHTFIQTLIDDPSSLAGQLIDSFSDIISTKKPRSSFCNKL